MADHWGYALLILCVFFWGGFLNTVSSSGSAVTLPSLISFGLSPNIANAANRIHVFVEFLVSTYQFHKKKLIDWKKTLTLSIPLIVGTILRVLLIEHLPTGYVNTLIILALFVSFSLAIYNFKISQLKKSSVHIELR
ncbi:MAG: hypothetical protein RL664_1542 [Bacteroidota bacterium]|jgi:uncharacterized membrane protein YfcA